MEWGRQPACTERPTEKLDRNEPAVGEARGRHKTVTTSTENLILN